MTPAARAAAADRERSRPLETPALLPRPPRSRLRPPGPAPSFADPRRRLVAADYLSLSFFGLLNLVAQTLRGLCAASQLERVQREVCEVTLLKDAMVFLPVSVSAEAIREEAAYQGVRVKVEARLGKIKLPLQVDIGFGDAVTPKAEKAEFPPLLDFPAPRLSMYGRETVVAEKFEAMVVLGLGHSR